MEGAAFVIWVRGTLLQVLRGVAAAGLMLVLSAGLVLAAAHHARYAPLNTPDLGQSAGPQDNELHALHVATAAAKVMASERASPCAGGFYCNGSLVIAPRPDPVMRMTLSPFRLSIDPGDLPAGLATEVVLPPPLARSA